MIHIKDHACTKYQITFSIAVVQFIQTTPLQELHPLKSVHEDNSQIYESLFHQFALCISVLKAYSNQCPSNQIQSSLKKKPH